MKLSKIFFFLILSVIVVFSSCKQDEISEEIPTVEPIIPEEVTTNPLVANVSASVSSTGGLDLGCFSIDLPFGLDIDGVEVQISSEEDFNNALMDEPEYIDFVYPLNITYPDGTTDVIDDGEELGEAFASCVPDGGWDYEEGDFPAYLICDLNSCYQIIYPLNLVDGDGNTYIATNEEEFIDLIAEHWDLFFEFPVNLLNADGETVTANSDEELFELLGECNEIIWPTDTIDWDGGGISQIGCYELGFPVSLVDEAGNVTVANDENEFLSAILNGDFVEFGYPITLIDEDGETIVVNNEEEFNEAFEECDFGGEPGGADFIPAEFLYSAATNFGWGDCYEVAYPLSILDPDGNTSTVNSDEEATELLNAGPWFIGFPLTITVDGTTETIADIESLFEILDSCE